jgi:hypothetical protein
MELERTSQLNEKGKRDVWFIFADWEKESLAKAARRRITDVKRILHRWENHPQDEGQVTYSEKRHECRAEIAFLEELIDTLS